jgi:hypothetical protein
MHWKADKVKPALHLGVAVVILTALPPWNDKVGKKDYGG